MLFAYISSNRRFESFLISLFGGLVFRSSFRFAKSSLNSKHAEHCPYKDDPLFARWVNLLDLDVHQISI